MASPTLKPKSKPSSKPASKPTSKRPFPARPPATAPEVVEPIWLLKAVAATIFAAFLCGYASLCLLLYQGQWQLLLHPKRTSSHPVQLAGVPIDFLRFGPDASGLPQRTAWSVQAVAGAAHANTTVLFLPSGDGSLVDALPTLTLLHNAGLNLLAIDYRGYGESAPLHPNQTHLTDDAEAAWNFLIHSRGVPEDHVVLWGTGFGASLAAQLAVRHPATHALILDAPAHDPLQIILADPRTKYLPVRLLFRERFLLAEPLATLKTPKLLIYSVPMPEAFQHAAAPKMSLQLSTPEITARYLQRFLDQYPDQ